MISSHLWGIGSSMYLSNVIGNHEQEIETRDWVMEELFIFKHVLFT